MPYPAARLVPRDPLPDPVELLRLAIDGMAQPLTALERLLDRMEDTR